ncbi:MAG: chromate transporter [Eubacteriales bacterium]|nr:chromate transporter [Eubacteriales bacterium]
MIYLELFWVFFKIGLFTFGGGYAMLPFIQQEVIAKGWLTLEETTNFIAVSESTPGPFAVNIATYIGVEKASIPGALCATFGIVLPSFIIILIVAKFFFAFRENKYVKGIMTGIKPAAIGLIGAAAFSIFYNVFIRGWQGFSKFTDYTFLYSAVIFTACLVLVLRKKSPILSIAVSAAAGIAAGYAGEALGLLK